MPKTITVLLTLFIVASSALGQHRKFDPAARAKEIAPFIDEQTIVVAHVDFTRVNVDAVFAIVVTSARMAKLTDNHAMKSLQDARALAEKFVADMVKAGATDAYIVVSIADIPSELLIIVPLGSGANERAISGMLYSGRPDGPTSSSEGSGRRRRNRMQVQTVRGAVVRCEQKVLHRVKAMKPHTLPELAKAFAAAGDTAAQLLVVPTADSRRVIEAMMPRLPAKIGGGPITTVTRGVMWMAIGADGPPKMSLRMHIQSQDAASAEALGALIPKAVDVALSEANKIREVRERLPNLKQIVATLPPQVQGDRLLLQLNHKQTETIVFDLLAPLLRRARKMAQRNVSATKLKVIGTAIAI